MALVGLILFIILLIFILRNYITVSSTNEPLTKKLMNYISNDGNKKDMLKNSGYDTIGEGNFPKGKRDNSNNSNSKNSNSKGTNKDKNTDVSLSVNKNIEQDLNTSDSLSHYFEKETNERINKLIRFGVDYCRASPNISLKNNKSLLNIGWRTQKFNYDVEYETVNFKGEKLSVSIITIKFRYIL
jgi:hypothetical protein